VILTREAVRPRLTNVTVAPITSTVRGISTEVPLGSDAGIEHQSVVSLDNIQTIPVADLGRQIGVFPDHLEDALAAAIRAAFDLGR
jgi:mRNA interferase MazF